MTSTARVGRSLLLLTLTLLNGTALRVAFSPVQEIAKGDLHLSDFQISLVQGLAAAIPVALLSIPLGRLIDRVNRVRMLMAIIAVSTVGTLLTVIATGFPMLFFARMLACFGGMCAMPVTISIAADLSPPERRGRALLFLAVGNMAGAGVAFVAGGALLSALSGLALSGDLHGLSPWRAMHLGFAAASTLLLVSLLTLSEPERHELSEARPARFAAAMSAIWSRRRLLIPLFIGQVTVVMADTVVGIWAAPVLTRNYGLQPAQFSTWLGLVILAAGIMGSVIGGIAADAGHKSRLGGGILLGAVLAAGLSIPAAFYPVMPTVTGFAWVVAFFLVCGSATGIITATALAVLIPNELRGVCLGAFMVFGALIGFGVAPTLVSWVSSGLGGEAYVGIALAITGAATSLIALIGFLFAFKALR